MHKDTCVFCKIAMQSMSTENGAPIQGNGLGILSADVFYTDDLFIGFRDIMPQAPVHGIVAYKWHINTLTELATSDLGIAAVACMLPSIHNAAQKLGLTQYRLVLNNGSGAGQTVQHVHAHILGGWAPNEAPRI